VEVKRSTLKAKKQGCVRMRKVMYGKGGDHEDEGSRWGDRKKKG
jgi:hypothetical protein